MNISIGFIQDLNLFNVYQNSPPLIITDKISQKIATYFEEIYQLEHSNIDFKKEAIGALIKLILIECNNASTFPKLVSKTKDSILREFKYLISMHYKKWHTTKDYSDSMMVSPDHLNRVIKAHTGQTAKKHIDSRIVVEAKRLLFFTDLSNKEIGYELGFSQPANFSAYFKKATELAPSVFRASFQKKMGNYVKYS